MSDIDTRILSLASSVVAQALINADHDGRNFDAFDRLTQRAADAIKQAIEQESDAIRRAIEEGTC